MMHPGEFVAEALEKAGNNICEEQVQPNGVDLRLGAVYEVLVRSWPNGNKYTAAKNDGETFFLKPGYYIVEFMERISIPSGSSGIVFPRSSLIRSGAMLYSALWDTGYSGVGKCGLQVFGTVDGSTLKLKKGERIAQLALMKSVAFKNYNGNYLDELPIGTSRRYF